MTVTFDSLSAYTVDADVREARGDFEAKEFRFQLSNFDEPHQRWAEARWQIAQMGYVEVRNVRVRNNR